MNLLSLLLKSLLTDASLSAHATKTGLSQAVLKKLIPLAIPLLIKFMTSKESNIWHSLKTGYVLSHVGVEEDPAVQAAWAEQPFKKVAFEQLQWLKETHVSAHMSDVDNELVKNLEAFASSDMSVDEMLDNLTAIMEENLPNGIVATYE